MRGQGAIIRTGSGSDGRIAPPSRWGALTRATVVIVLLAMPVSMAQATERSLTPGQSLDARLAANATDTLAITVPDGFAATLTLSQIDQPLELRGFPTGDAPIQKPAGGRESRLLLTITGSPLPMTVAASEPASQPGRDTAYRVSLSEAVPITPTVRRIIEGETALARAEALRRGSDAGRFAAARPLYTQARTAFAAAGAGCQLRVAWLGSGRLEYGAADYPAAAAAGRAALTTRCPDDRADAAKVHHLLAVTNSALGDYFGAAASEQLALVLTRAIGGDPVNEATLLGNLGTMYRVIGDSGRALATVREALDLATRIGDRERIAFVRDSLAGLYLTRGELATALALHRQTLVDLEGLKFPLVEGNARLNLGITLYRLGDDAAALDTWADGERICTASHDDGCLISILASRGDLHRDRGRLDAAEADYRRGLMLAQDGQRAREIAYLQRGLGLCAMARGQHDEARVLLERAVAAFRRVRAGEEIVALLALGDLEQKVGRVAEARSQYEHGLSLAQAQAEHGSEVVALASLARLDFDAGALDRARSRIEQALARVEAERARIDEPSLRTRYFESSRAYYELLIDIRMAQHQRQPQAGHAAAALVVAERARARTLSDQLASRSLVAALAPPSKAVTALLAERDAAADALRVLSYRLTRTPTSEPAARRLLERDLDRATRALDAVRGRLRAADARFAEAADPQPVDLRDVQQHALDADTVLLETWFGSRASWLWVLTRDGLAVHRLPPRGVLEPAITALRQRIATPVPLLPGQTLADLAAREAEDLATTRQMATALRKTLLGPAGALPQTRRVIVADGELQRLPLAVLDDANGPASVYLPSIQTLRWLRDGAAPRRGQQVAILADPVFAPDDPRLKARSVGSAARQPSVDRAAAAAGVPSLPRLPNSRAEADSLSARVPADARRVLVDFDASRDAALNADWSNTRIVHFATHALLDFERPELSGVVLSLFDARGQPQDGFLRINDLYRLKLPVDLVVLSTCESALGASSGAEGVFNLARPLFYAGARRVLASLWTVDDRAASEFMRRFYDAHLGERLDAASALQRAQFSMANDPHWAAPYYWAGYVLQGDWREAAR